MGPRVPLPLVALIGASATSSVMSEGVSPGLPFELSRILWTVLWHPIDQGSAVILIDRARLKNEPPQRHVTTFVVVRYVDSELVRVSERLKSLNLA